MSESNYLGTGWGILIGCFAATLTLAFAEAFGVLKLLEVQNAIFESVHHGKLKLNVAGFFFLCIMSFA